MTTNPDGSANMLSLNALLVYCAIVEAFLGVMAIATSEMKETPFKYRTQELGVIFGLFILFWAGYNVIVAGYNSKNCMMKIMVATACVAYILSHKDFEKTWGFMAVDIVLVLTELSAARIAVALLDDARKQATFAIHNQGLQATSNAMEYGAAGMSMQTQQQQWPICGGPVGYGAPQQGYGAPQPDVVVDVVVGSAPPMAPKFTGMPPPQMQQQAYAVPPPGHPMPNYPGNF
eukprot:gnl/TRDRNA2_/TRDRNA2_35213_c0_seq1.p1 gnl/TRDRNA2_/TRDRNA2_35213_c0~~gnl/TRDRNA2_/TRDRNA2_35213_c0_seq1.p1  ORF type:complete len:254 (+),score=45.28 gnl/TRDRNA2_/TRDRNA2_35213_c0_seq1:67-762(+)